MVFVGFFYPLLTWLALTYQGWLGRRLGMDKAPSPLKWDDPSQPPPLCQAGHALTQSGSQRYLDSAYHPLSEPR